MFLNQLFRTFEEEVFNQSWRALFEYFSSYGGITFWYFAFEKKSDVVGTKVES